MERLEGITYCHEHTTIDLSPIKETDDTNLNCFEETVLEYKKLYEKGVRRIVDVTVAGMGRNPSYVKRVAKASGIRIIQSTGFYIEGFFPPIVTSSSAQELAEFMIREIREGIEGSDIKASVIGEIGSSENQFTDNELKVFEGAVLAQKETGVPMITHAHLGTFGHEQVAFFEERGVELSKVAIGHVDLTGDAKYVLDMLRQGVYVVFDTVGKENYMPDLRRAQMLKAIESSGFADQVLMSMDITRKSNMEHRGGIGYSYLLDVFVPLLLDNGVSQTTIKKILVANPRAFFGE